jgi:hypothetical protein
MKKTTTKNTASAKENTIDLPEVKDIPGQEHVRPPRIREMEDSTPSSSDEEATELLSEINEEEVDLDENSNVSDLERELLEKTDRPDNEETKDLEKLALDTDEDGEELNEESNPADLGKDLDIPGSELDDDNEEIGEEDEENNSYSRPD